MNIKPTSILLIDDDPVINMIHSKLLKRVYPQPEQVIFEDPVRAFKYLADHFSQLNFTPFIFLDINMPEMNGWEFLERLGEDFPDLDIPVAILSSSIDKEDRERSKHYTAVRHYLTKPFNPSLIRIPELMSS